MVTVDWAPFYGSDMTNYGVITEIVQTAFKRVDIQASIRFIPWKRAMQEVSIGKTDILMGAYYTEERDQTFFYSDAIYEITLGLIALKSLGVNNYKNLKELRPYTIGISRGWANSEEFDEADYLKKEGASNQILNVRKLFKKRVDMISISFGVFRYEVASTSNYKIEDVIFIKPPLNISPIYLITSRSNPNKESVMRAFNMGLTEIKQDGSYDKILRAHGF
ncbi:MAG: transporter substrate-binding domain-containing protein [Psychromonas sp.]|nr:transporter substrate-binding domain-containing protein [Alteromonadales bacterium]MCP5078780.1 transporter substrate-binding domain-containing protein [Psychromonas sp.]